MNLEYKCVSLKIEGNLRDKEVPDLESALNHYAKYGWRLIDKILLPVAMMSTPSDIILVLEREAKDEEGSD